MTDNKCCGNCRRWARYRLGVGACMCDPHELDTLARQWCREWAPLRPDQESRREDQGSRREVSND